MLEDDAQAERRFQCFEKALQLDPYLKGALNEQQLAAVTRQPELGFLAVTGNQFIDEVDVDATS